MKRIDAGNRVLMNVPVFAICVPYSHHGPCSKHSCVITSDMEVTFGLCFYTGRPL